MSRFSARGPVRLVRRVLSTARGRPFASFMLIFILLISFLAEPPSSLPLGPAVERAAAFIGEPLTSARLAVFDGYQRLFPRQPAGHPVTIVAIDEKSLEQLGQWPWPRDRLADLIRAINAHQPAAIGLDLYLPEPDQTSPQRLADRLSPQQDRLARSLRALPSHDELLAGALRESPSVLGMVGFDFHAYTSRAGLRSFPLLVQGDDARPLVYGFESVLASMPELQAASHGQGMLSVQLERGSVRRFPLLCRVGDQLVAGMALEMFRVATGTEAIEVRARKGRVESLQVADLTVPTQPHGDVWLHFSRLETGRQRYVSAWDVLQQRVPAEFFTGKLVLLGMTGMGLSDMRSTVHGEIVPGVEVQAQLMESLFDGRFLLRPWWIKWVELLLAGVIGASLIWFVPRADSRLSYTLRAHPAKTLLALALADVLILAAGVWLFQRHGLLFDAATLVIVLSMVMAVLLGSALIEGMGEARTRLAQLVDYGLLLGREHDRQRLLEQTLFSARQLALCQAGVILLRTGDDTLRFALGTRRSSTPKHDIALRDAQGNLRTRCIAAHVVAHGQTLLIDELVRDERFDAEEIRSLGLPPAVEPSSVLTVPMRLGDGRVMGLLLLINALDPQTREVVPFDPRVAGFMEALAAQAAVALENKNLLESQENLFDAVVRMIASATDAKSPYTGGHCERVPELAIMLAEEACRVKDGPLADFEFKTEEEWREFRIGAWLHDAGKVTTPEYVVDKATKLETIFNRIHEIRTRFEVLLRDAQIECLQAIHERGEDRGEATRRYELRRAELADDYAFIAQCNVGSETLPPEHVERMRRIARTPWLRHFDDRLGLSHEELLRHGSESAPTLPATETLLADKPQHLVERPPSQALDPKYGFKLKVPRYLYNHGEVHNLSIPYGTLTEEERFKINEHIIQTIFMIEQMPLPASMKRVPEYAGTHHETLTGTGYPRQLGAAELSVPARIVAIADIFEALTAGDRPYKKAKSLSESVAALHRLKQKGHIDPVLFDLFLTSGIYRRYAERYLQPEQIDEVDIRRYLG